MYAQYKYEILNVPRNLFTNELSHPVTAAVTEHFLSW